MLRVPRSPGSTLKPLIYGLAFENGLIAQNTVMEDRPANFSGYRPRNFDSAYQGDVSVRDALQMSLNVPAVQLLEAVGTPALFCAPAPCRGGARVAEKRNAGTGDWAWRPWTFAERSGAVVCRHWLARHCSLAL